jgi:hypothetical protein
VTDWRILIAKHLFSPPIVSPPTPKQAESEKESMEKKQRKSRTNSETSLFASTLSFSDAEASEVIERQCGGKATQVAKKEWK